MKTIRWLLVTVLVLGATGWMLARAEGGSAGDAEAQVRALQKRVENLQAQLKALEKRLAKVEAAKPQPAPRIQILPRTPGSPPALTFPSPPYVLGKPPAQPKVWGQRQVNGWTYYFIPCGDN